MAGGKAGGEGSKDADKDSIRATFELFDVDGSGEVDRGELKAVAEKLGVPMSEADLNEAMLTMDEDGSGEVDLEEFTAWYLTLDVLPFSRAPER